MSLVKFLLYSILFLSIAGTISFLISLLCCGLFGRKINHTFKYYIWIITLIMFVVPVRLNIVNVNEFQIPQNEFLPEIITNNLSEQTQSEVETIHETREIPVKSERRNIDLIFTLFLIWFVISGILLLRQLYVRIKFYTKLKRITNEPDNEMKKILEITAEKIKLYRNVELKTVNADLSPFVTGIIKPVVIIPSNVNTEDLQYILCHELVHIKRKDLLYMLAVSVVRILHWFNPAVCIMEHIIRKEMEYSCDEKTVKILGDNERKNYSAAILHSVKNNISGIRCGAFLSEDAKKVKNRMEAIMNKRKMFKIPCIILAMILLVANLAGASAVNEINPVESAYIINKVTDNGGYSLDIKTVNGEVDTFEGPIGETVRETILINSPFYKNFYCIIKSDGICIKPMRLIKAQENNSAKEVEGLQLLDVRMEKFEKSICDGNVWCGYFSVYRNGSPIIENSYGNITNVPDGNSRGFSDLILEDGFYIENLNFGLKSEDIINSIYETDQLRASLYESDGTDDIWLEPQKLMYKGEELEIPKENYEYSVSVNRKLSLINVFLHLEDIGYLGTDSSNVEYTEDNKIVYTKLTRQSKTTDEFKGEIRGLFGQVGETVVFDFGDDFYGAFTISKITEKVDDIRLIWSPNSGSEMFKNGEQKVRAVKLEHLPFEISLSSDRKYIEVTVKESFDYWDVAAADYGTSPYGNMFEWKTKETDGNTLVFPVVAENISHNIQGRFERFSPYAQQWNYDIMFKVINGEILYTSCSETTFVNKEYSGEKAEEEFKLIRRKY